MLLLLLFFIITLCPKKIANILAVSGEVARVTPKRISARYLSTSAISMLRSSSSGALFCASELGMQLFTL